jgi:hypothetical protein
VTAATWLLLVAALLILVGTGADVAVAGTISDVYGELYAGTGIEGMEGLVTAGAVGGAVLFALVAAGLVVLALLNHRGNNPARIVTWVVGGIALCCTGLGLAGSSLTSGLGGDVDGPSPAEVQQALDAAMPGWYGPVSAVTTIASILALLVALVLLALPPSNEFFRKAPPQVEPPPYPSAG